MKTNYFYVITGGTLVGVAPHFSLCSPSFGETGAQIARQLESALKAQGTANESYRVPKTLLVRTRMALGASVASVFEQQLFEAAGIPHLETNQDLERLLSHLLSRPDTRGIVMATEVCDWKIRYLVQENSDPEQLGVWTKSELGTQAMPRVRASNGDLLAAMVPTGKLITGLRKARQDFMLVGFKSTQGASKQEQYEESRQLLQGAPCDLVFAQDRVSSACLVVGDQESTFRSFEEPKAGIRDLCRTIATYPKIYVA